MASQSSRRRGLRRLPLILRLVVSLAIAFLTLPLVNAPAAADDTSTVAAEANVTTTDTGAAAGTTGTVTADPATTDPAAATGTAGTTAATSTGAATTTDVGTTAAASTTAGSSTTSTTSTSSSSSTTVQRTTSKALVAAIAPLVVAGDLTSATYQPVDEQGPNDEPGQKDLTRLWAWSPSGGTVKIGWNWDEIAWSGNNTGDACALFDTDQDGNANYAVCVTVSGNPATQLNSASNPSPRVYSCKDNRSTNCDGAVAVSKGTTSCVVGQTDTDPFVGDDAYPTDTSALCTVDLSAVGGATTTVLTNVCSYPSQQPNSDYSDCVLAPRDALLTVVKHTTAGDDLFSFTLTTSGVSQLFAQLHDGQSFSGGVASGKNLDLEETSIPTGWTLLGATCDNGQDPASLKLASGAHVTCTFTNSRTASVVVYKKWRVNGGAPVAPGDPSLNGLGVSASLTLTGPGTAGATAQPFGTERTGYVAGDHTSVDETASVSNALCSLGSATITPPGASPAALPDTGYDATLAGGLNTYTITNNVTCRGHLTLTKSVANGDTSASAWTLTATRSSAGDLAGPSGQTGTSGDVTAGATYTLSEDNADPAYVQQGGWSCTNGVTATNGQISVPAGVSTTCTVTNATAKLVLRKVVHNTHGGTLAPSAFTLTATPTAPTGGAGTVNVIGNDGAGVASWVRPGVAYALSEGDVAGYSRDSLKCDTGTGGALESVTSVTLQAEDVVTCTFTNVDVPSRLTLTKEVFDPDGSGTTYTAEDFTLTATLQSAPGTVVSGNGLDGVVGVEVSAGTWALSESGPAGFTEGTWDCGVDHPVTDQAGKHLVTIGLDEDVTCQIGNTAQKPHLTLVKEVAGNDATGGSAAPDDWTLTASGPETVSGTTSDFAGGMQVLVGDYALSESGGVPGYTPGEWYCGATHPLTGGKVTLELGDNVTCTIVNTAQQPHLTLVKHVDNGSTGATAVPADWTLSAVNGQVDSLSGPGGASGDVKAGSYTLSEDGPAGYDASAWNCGKGHPVTAGSVAIALGDDVTCEITNTAQQPHLTLVKHVDNGSTGATAVPADWTLSAVNGQVDSISGPGGASDDVMVGTYNLSELAADIPRTEGYTASAWDCGEGHPVIANTVAIALGDDVTCEITNTAQQPHLTLVKHVDNGSTGATAVPADWTLSAVNGQVDSLSGPGGATGAVEIGSYTLSEDGPAGYDASGWDCGEGHPVVDDTVAIGLGDDVTCEITNTAQQPHLTLVKHVDNGETGTAEATDWTLSAVNGDVDSLSGAGGATGAVEVGSYTLSEQAAAIDRTVGYTASAWDCGEGNPVVDNTVAIALGDDVTCEITNTATPPAWELTKTSDPVSGSEVEPGSDITYTLRAVNTSGAVVQGAKAEDDLSNVLNHASIDSTSLADGLTLTGNTLTWAVPRLAPGEEATISYTVTVDENAYDIVVENVVVPVGEGGLCVEDSDCTTTHRTGPQVLGEEIVKPKPRPPVVLGGLPSTGAPSHSGLLGLVGAAAIVLGAGLMLTERRRRATRG